MNFLSLADHARNLWSGTNCVGGRDGVSGLLFHGTSPSAVAEIKRVGLTPTWPRGTPGASGLVFPEPMGVYLTDLPGVAREIVRMKHGHAPVLWDRQRLDDNYRVSEPEDAAVVVVSVYGLRMIRAGYYVCPIHIPPSRVRGSYGELLRAGKKLVDSHGVML